MARTADESVGEDRTVVPAKAGPRRDAVADFRIERREAGGSHAAVDSVAVEEPLEIRVRHAGSRGLVVAVTMRTPGRDADLAIGFLHGEGLLTARSEVIDAITCTSAANVVHVTVGDSVPIDRFGGTRRFYTTSSCGLCGRDSLDAVLAGLRGRRVAGVGRVTVNALAGLPLQVRERQAAFRSTGGLHAAALVALDGTILDVAEDVGRHNAVDKVLGRAFLHDALPATDHVLFLSGRAGFELVQKAVMAGVSIVASVGAPTSLAIDLAREAGLTLAGFVGGRRCNVYAGAERIDG